MRRRSADKKIPGSNGSPKGSGLPEEDVSLLFDHLQSEEKNERVWKEMTAQPWEDDSWGEVEEHLLHKEHERNHRLRRWKYFAK